MRFSRKCRLVWCVLSTKGYGISLIISMPLAAFLFHDSHRLSILRKITISIEIKLSLIAKFETLRSILTTLTLNCGAAIVNNQIIVRKASCYDLVRFSYQKCWLGWLKSLGTAGFGFSKNFSFNCFQFLQC